jgi:beta-galactosidase
MLRTTLLDPDGEVVKVIESPAETVSPDSDREWVCEFRVEQPKLWSPDTPHLHTVRSELIDDGRVVDSECTRTGIRRIEITNDGLRINGELRFLRGANRHQEYPYIGNALSDAAQYRDAFQIKQAGFDYVRLSHYPQSPAFLDACDELGLVVMNCLMGWQYFNPDPAFAELKYQECRQLMRRDRNHPSVILWEVSLNESRMPREFIRKTHEIAHEEHPGDQCYTCGWTDGYDVFIQARQHGGCRSVTNRPCVVSEYGDWEYFAQNAGLQQHLWKDLQPAERNSRQLRGDGEKRLLQQALNFQEAHNDNLKTTAFADGIWVMYDYNRGYAPDIEASGVMDIFRLPKFGYWFFRSQRDADEPVAGKPVGPMVFIANHWTPDSTLEVRVFSNCEEVELHLNGKPVDRRRPDTSRVSTHVNHPPFTFALDRFEAGTLRAVGFIDGRPVAHGEQRTPGEPSQLSLEFQLGNRPFGASGKDAVFCHAELRDKAGTRVPGVEVPVFFGVNKPARLTGHNPILSEAGVGTVLLESESDHASAVVYALCQVRTDNGVRILSAAGSPSGKLVPDYVIRYTTDGTEPTAAASVYEGPIKDAPSVQAALFAEGHRIAIADNRSSAASTRSAIVQTAQNPAGSEH